MWILQNTWVSHYSQIPNFINLFLDNLLDTRRQFGMVKSALYWVSERARFTAYKACSLLHHEYVSAAWVPTWKKDIADLKRIQLDAIHFITNTNGRDLKDAME